MRILKCRTLEQLCFLIHWGNNYIFKTGKFHWCNRVIDCNWGRELFKKVHYCPQNVYQLCAVVKPWVSLPVTLCSAVALSLLAAIGLIHWYRLYMDFRTALILGQYSIQAKSSVHCYWITLSKHYFTTSTLIGWWPIVLMISGSSYSLQLLLGQHGGGYRLLFIIDYCIIFDKLSCFISTTK